MHLDLDMRDALTSALQAYAGALVTVSHDRHLLDATTDELWLVHDSEVRDFRGDLDDYRNWLLNTDRVVEESATAATEGQSNGAAKPPPRAKRVSRRKPKHANASSRCRHRQTNWNARSDNWANSSTMSSRNWRRRKSTTMPTSRTCRLCCNRQVCAVRSMRAKRSGWTCWKSWTRCSVRYLALSSGCDHLPGANVPFVNDAAMLPILTPISGPMTRCRPSGGGPPAERAFNGQKLETKFAPRLAMRDFKSSVNKIPAIASSDNKTLAFVAGPWHREFYVAVPSAHHIVNTKLRPRTEGVGNRFEYCGLRYSSRHVTSRQHRRTCPRRKVSDVSL